MKTNKDNENKLEIYALFIRSLFKLFKLIPLRVSLFKKLLSLLKLILYCGKVTSLLSICSISFFNLLISCMILVSCLNNDTLSGILFFSHHVLSFLYLRSHSAPFSYLFYSR